MRATPGFPSRARVVMAGLALSVLGDWALRRRLPAFR